jgi:hypothetical protein
VVLLQKPFRRHDLAEKIRFVLLDGERPPPKAG